MGTPDGKLHQHQAMGDLGGLLVKAHVEHYFKKGSTILDVGAGWGKYRFLLPDYQMDACEVWEPYIKEEKLEKLYDRVFNVDVCDLHDVKYDVIILGDVLEHIERERAIETVNRLKSSCEQMYVVVPFQYHQGEVHGNKYEIHLQDDLTDDMVKELYNLTLLAKDDIKGVYTK